MKSFTITVETMIVLEIKKMNTKGNKAFEVKRINGNLSYNKPNFLTVSEGYIRFKDENGYCVCQKGYILTEQELQETILRLRCILFMVRMNNHNINDWIQDNSLPEFGEGVTVQTVE